jgi:hypothetical protein
VAPHKKDTMNNLAKAYTVVRDATFDLPVAEVIAVIEVIKAEVIAEALENIKENS